MCHFTEVPQPPQQGPAVAVAGVNMLSRLTVVELPEGAVAPPPTVSPNHITINPLTGETTWWALDPCGVHRAFLTSMRAGVPRGACACCGAMFEHYSSR